MPKNPQSNTDRALSLLTDVEHRFDPRLRIFVDELLKWNPQLGVISKKAPVETIAKLVGQSIELYDFTLGHMTTPVRRVLDIGSGGGFPGVVWKLLDPTLDVTLVERRASKAGFLERLIHRIEAPHLHVRPESAEVTALIPEFVGACDVVTTMAVALTDELAKAIRLLLATTGALSTLRPLSAPTVPGFSEIARQDRADSALVLMA